MPDSSRPSDQSIRELLPRVGLLPQAVDLEWTCYSRPGEVFGKQWDAYQLDYTGVFISGSSGLRPLISVLDTAIYGEMPSARPSSRRQFNIPAEKWISDSFRFWTVPSLWRPEQVVLFRVVIKLDGVGGHLDIAFRRKEPNIRVIGSFKDAAELQKLCEGAKLYDHVETRGRKRGFRKEVAEQFKRDLEAALDRLKPYKRVTRELLAEQISVNVKTLDSYLKESNLSMQDIKRAFREKISEK